MKVWADYHDYHSGEHFGTINADHPEHGRIGQISFGYYKPAKTVHIKYIETHEDHRRKGVATAMMKELKRQHPRKKIHWGGMTDDGAKFKRGMRRKVTMKYGWRRKLKEDAVPVNNAGGGQVAGLGGNNGEPGRRLKRFKSFLVRRKNICRTPKQTVTS